MLNPFSENRRKKALPTAKNLKHPLVFGRILSHDGLRNHGWATPHLSTAGHLTSQYCIIYFATVPSYFCRIFKIWLVVWNICFISIQLGMSSSQLTSIFFRGVGLNHQPEIDCHEIIEYPKTTAVLAGSPDLASGLVITCQEAPVMTAFTPYSPYPTRSTGCNLLPFGKLTVCY